MLLAKWQEIPGYLASLFQAIRSYPAQRTVSDVKTGGDLFQWRIMTKSFLLWFATPLAYGQQNLEKYISYGLNNIAGQLFNLIKSIIRLFPGI